MSMQQPASKQRGASGETAVSLFVEDLGWGVIPTAGDHDLGTDLYVQIRDADLREMLLMLGVQVKTGDSFFAEPGVHKGQSGWWYREGNQAHANYWTNHPIPHIIVLQSGNRSTRVWSFINRETILNTGEGFKVFVPGSQTLTKESSADMGNNRDQIVETGIHGRFALGLLDRGSA